MSETHDAVSRILESESTQAEETKRFNAERAILLGLAPDKWREIKEAITRECNAVTRASHRLTFKCAEQGANALEISRLYRDIWLSAAQFVYIEEVPAVFFEYQRAGDSVSGNLRFALCGSTVTLVIGNAGIILPHFLTQLLIDISR